MTLAFATALLSMAAVFVFKTLAEAVFLGEFGVTYLPHFFIAHAAAMITISAGYARLIRRGSFRVDLAVLALTLAAGFLAPQIARYGGGATFAISLFLVTSASVAQLALWNAAAAMFKGRKARQLLPRLGAAATGGAVLGSLGASALSGAIGIESLGPVGGGLITLCLAMRVQVWLLRRSRRRATKAVATSPLRAPMGPAARRLVLILAVSAALESLLTQLVDYGFKSELIASFPDEDKLGVFLALFYGGVNIVLLAVQVFASSHLLSTRSLRRALSVEPLLLASMLALWAALPTLILAASARAGEMILKFSVARPAQEVALTPLSERRRGGVKVLLRGVYSQGGAALAGALLIFAGPLLIDVAMLLPAVCAAVALVWLWLSRRAAGAYLEAVGAALGSRRLSARRRRDDAALDQEAVDRVVALLSSEDDSEVEFARDLIAEVAQHSPRPLLRHAESGRTEVRRLIFELLATRRYPPAVRALERAVAEERDDGVLAALFAALGRNDSAAGIERARQRIRDGDGGESSVERAAWLYLVRLGAHERDEHWRERCIGHLHRDGKAIATALSGAIRRGSVTAAEAEELVLAAQDTDDPHPLRESMKAAAMLGRSRPLANLLKAVLGARPWIPEVVSLLDDAAMGRLLLLAGARNLGAEERSRLLRALRSSDTDSARRYALSALEDEDSSVRSQAVRLLRRIGTGEELESARIDSTLQHQLDRFELFVAARPSLPSFDRESLFEVQKRRVQFARESDALFFDELERATEREMSRLCALVALLGEPESVFAAERALRSPSFKVRRQAVDIIQELHLGAVRGRLLRLLESYLVPPANGAADALDRVCAADPWLQRVRRCDEPELLERVSALRCSLLFDRMDGESVLALARRAEVIRVGEDRVVVAEGEPGDALYVIMHGALDVSKGGERLSQVGPGEVFGELALIDGMPRGATVRSVSEATLLRLDRQSFLDSLEENREIGQGLVLGLSKWLRTSTHG